MLTKGVPPKYHTKIRRVRSCTLVPRCVMGTATNMTGSGAGGTFKLSTENSASSSSSFSCVGILDTLSSLSLRGQTIDLLNIDIEGNEASVLRCLPFSEIDIRAVLIETNKQKE